LPADQAAPLWQNARNHVAAITGTTCRHYNQADNVPEAGFIQWIELVESTFIEEGETPPAHIRPVAIAEFCKRYRVEPSRVSAALEAWECDDPQTVH